MDDLTQQELANLLRMIEDDSPDEEECYEATPINPIIEWTHAKIPHNRRNS